MTTQKSPLILIQLYRLLTLRDTSFMSWLFVAFFWLLGWAVPAYFVVANFFLLSFYYLRLLPDMLSLLNSRYGQLLFNKTLRATAPALCISLMTLLTFPGFLHYANLPHSELLTLLFCSHSLLHTLVFSIKGKQLNAWLIVLLLLLQFNPAWPLQLTKPYLIVFCSVIVITSLLYLRTIRMNGRRVKSDSSWLLRLRTRPDNHSCLANSLLFQNKGGVIPRLIVFTGICFTAPLILNTIIYVLTEQWLWIPDTDWHFINNVVFFAPFVYWSYNVLTVLGRLKLAWLHLPASRQHIFVYFERHFLGQLGVFMMPMLALLYLVQPEHANSAFTILLVLSMLIFLTYYFLCFFNNNAIAFISGFIGYFSASNWFLTSDQRLQLYIAISLMLLSAIMRTIAVKRWPKLNLTKVSNQFRKRHV